MRLTTKGRYAVTAMLDLALHDHQGPVCLADIAQRQGISLSYLEQLFVKLRRQHLVISLRGPGGGYRLGQTKESITLAQIIAAVAESVDATGCQGERGCQQGAVCLTHSLWVALNEHIHHFFSSISLADCIAQQAMQPPSALINIVPDTLPHSQGALL